MTDTEFNQLLQQIRNNSITNVYLNGNQIGDSGATAVAEALKVNKTITNVNLNGNQIGASGATAVAEALKVNKTITTVDIGYNQIGASGATAVAEALKVNKTITNVNLADNQIGASGATAVAEALKVNKTITTVNLWNNQIGASGATAVAEALKVNKTITNVSLWNNQIGDSGATAVAEALKVNKTITNVSLWNNQIGDSGATAVAEALKVNKTITTVYLYNNQIGDSGATAVAEALKVNKTITNVNLNGNQIGDSGATAVAEALKVNKTITNVSLWNNQIGDSGATAVAEALKVNKTITTVNLDSNQIGDNILNIIKANLKLNQLIFNGNNCASFNPKQAIGYYKEVLETDSKIPDIYPDIYIKLAECHTRINKYQEAINYYNQLLALDLSKALIVYKELVNCYKKLNQYEDALHCADEVLKLTPMDQEARNIKVEIILHLSDGCKSHALHDDAIRHLQQALLVHGIDNDQKIDIRAKISASFKAQGKYQEALNYLQDGSTKYKETVKEIAEIHRDIGKVQEAIRYYQQALSLSPGDQNIKNEIAKLLSQAGDYEQALKYFQADDSDEYIDLLIRVGNGHYQNQEIRKALQYYEQALELRSNLNRINVFEHIAICYHTLQNFAQSLIYCNRAISMQSQDQIVKNTKFDVLTKLADSVNAVQAIEYLVEALTIKPRDQEIIVKIARLYTEQGEFAQALEFYNRVLVIDRNNEAIKHEIGKIYLQQGNYESAREYLLKTSSEYSTACQQIVSNLIQVANQEYQQGKYQEALNHYVQSLEHASDKGEVYKNMANCCNKLELYEDAITYAKEASNSHIRWKIEAKEIIVRALVSFAQNCSAQDAEVHLREALKLKINDADIKNELGKALAEQGKHKEALNYLTDSASSLKSIIKIAKEYAKKDDKDSQAKALKYYHKALNIGSDESMSEDIRNKVGELYFKAGNHGKAVEYLPENGDLWKEAQEILNSKNEEFKINALKIKVKESLDNEKKEEAIDFLKQILEIKVSQGDILELCNILKDLGKYEEALGYLNIFGNKIALDKRVEQELSLYNAEALERFEAGDVANAIENFAKALTVSPNNSEIINNLAWALLETEDSSNYGQAIGYFRAVSCKIGESIANNRLGEVYLNEGKYAEAIRYFEDALKLQADDLYQNNLGDAYLKYGRLKEAINCFEQINRIGTKQYDRAIEYKEITLNELLKEAKVVCKKSGNNISDLEVVVGYYDRLKELCKANQGKEEYKFKQAYYLGKEAKFVMAKLTDNDKAEDLANQAIIIDPNCQDAQYVISTIAAAEAELAGNSDDSFEL